MYLKLFLMLPEGGIKNKPNLRNSFARTIHRRMCKAWGYRYVYYVHFYTYEDAIGLVSDDILIFLHWDTDCYSVHKG